MVSEFQLFGVRGKGELVLPHDLSSCGGDNSDAFVGPFGAVLNGGLMCGQVLGSVVELEQASGVRSVALCVGDDVVVGSVLDVLSCALARDAGSEVHLRECESLPQQDGLCYLAMVRLPMRQAVAARIGYSPSLRQLLMIGADELDLMGLACLSYEHVGGQAYHVYDGLGCGLSGMLRGSAAAYPWLDSPVGKVLGKGDPGRALPLDAMFGAGRAANAEVRARILRMVKDRELSRVAYCMEGQRSGTTLSRTDKVEFQAPAGEWVRFACQIPMTGLIVLPPRALLRKDGVTLLPVDGYTGVVIRYGAVFELSDVQELSYLSLDKNRWAWVSQFPGFLGPVADAYRFAYLADALFVVAVVSPQESAAEGMPLLEFAGNDDGTGEELQGSEFAYGCKKLLLEPGSGPSCVWHFGPVLVSPVHGAVLIGDALRVDGQRVVYDAGEHGRFSVIGEKEVSVSLEAVVDSYEFDGGGPSGGESEVSGAEFFPKSSLA